MFGFRKKAPVQRQVPDMPAQLDDEFGFHYMSDVMRGFDQYMEDSSRRTEESIENSKRREWFSSRLWHNGDHAHCCPKCLQAGYVMALVRAGRLDLLGEYPELLTVYDQLRREGMLQPVLARRR